MHDIIYYEIINQYSDYLQKYFKLKVNQDYKVLSSKYWIP